jgi:hypothetical protein
MPTPVVRTPWADGAANNPATDEHAQLRSKNHNEPCGWLCTCGDAETACPEFGFDTNTAGDPTEAPMYEPGNSLAQVGNGMDQS